MRPAILCVFLSGCAITLPGTAGEPTGYALAKSQDELFNRLRREALANCKVGDDVYFDLGDGAAGVYKGKYWCVTPPPGTKR